MATKPGLGKMSRLQPSLRGPKHARGHRPALPGPRPRALPSRRSGVAGRGLRRSRRVLRAPPVRLPGRPALPLRREPALQALGAAHRRTGLLRRLGTRRRATASVLPPARRLLAPAARVAGRRLAGRVRHRHRARAGGGPLPARPGPPPPCVHRRMAGGVRAVGIRRGQPAGGAGSPAPCARRQDALRTRLHAPRVGARRARPRRGARRLPRRRLGVRGAPRLLRGGGVSATTTCPTATSSPSTRVRRCCTTSTSTAGGIARGVPS